MRNICHFIHAWRWNIIKKLRIISNINRATSELFEAICTSCFIYQVWNAWLASCFKLFASITSVEFKIISTLKSGIEGQLLSRQKNNKIWRHFGVRCIIKIKNINFQKTSGTFLPDICFWSQSRFESFLPLSGGTALEESKTGTTKSLFRFNCACVKCSCLPHWLPLVT